MNLCKSASHWGHYITPVFALVRFLADMKRYILWIVLFKLTTTYGYPQINISCTRTEPGSDVDHDEAMTPSALKNLTVSLADMHEGHSAAALNISWAINIDYSNKYLTGTKIYVEDKYFLCHYRPTFHEVNTTGHEQLWFHYTEIPVEPARLYLVTGFNLPEDDNEITYKYETPDCSNERMRPHESCLYMEWNPNITSNFVNGQVEVSFTSSKYSTVYELLLWRCASQNECFPVGEYIRKDTKGESRWTTTLNSTGPCDSLHIGITPHFAKCPNKLCDKSITRVDCSPRGEYYWLMKSHS
ncbi:hypothetical protein SKAU_G00108760 [Synaphobranchus kaupii]|uniref:IL17RA/B N-terminal domain-containing protein n=1 Tax=Synaphobranchus kaupii TaxID=118154 RepID=A0A9Q1J868_SYNKA|nr:hypothetical protein SKAU_G00108760 [Synaphobranchus kaupii]